MKIASLVSVALVSVALIAGGCGKKEEAAGGGDEVAAGGDDKGATKAPEKSGGAGTIVIAKLGLKADVPAGAKAGDAIVGDGVMIKGPGVVVGIDLANDMTPKTVEEAVKETEMYDGVANMKQEKLADGYIISFENKGGMGTNYWVKSVREIGGKAYTCDTTASQPEQQKNALAVCKSLKQ